MVGYWLVGIGMGFLKTSEHVRISSNRYSAMNWKLNLLFVSCFGDWPVTGRLAGRRSGAIGTTCLMDGVAEQK